MRTNNQLSIKGTSLVSIGGLFTILSLTIVKDATWNIVLAGIGVLFAIMGVIMMRKSGKKSA